MPNPFVRKLDALGPLSDRDKKLLKQAVVATQWVDANRDLVRVGERPSGCTLILQGTACGYRVLETGQRQITSFKLPGDLCGLDGFLMGKAAVCCMDLEGGCSSPNPVWDQAVRT